MSKLVLRSILISIALVIILLLLFKNRLPFGSGNSSFATGPEREITRVDFSEHGKQLSLEKKGENWFVNDGPEARKSGILFILRILHEISIKSPVSSDLFKSEITGKGIDPVSVKVYENRKLLNSFLVYKTSSNIYGNIMKIREGSKPFIVSVPGYDGDIGSAFTLNELFWKPYTVFNLLPSEIESVEFENLTDTSSSFIIKNRNHKYELSSLNHKLSGWDSALVTRYLSYFAWIPFEKWALDMSEDERNRVGSTQPLYIITVTASGGQKTVLSLWEKMKKEEGKLTLDSDRVLGRTQNSKEFFIMRYFDIDPLLKRRTYFFRE